MATQPKDVQSTEVTYEVKHHVATLTINRPEGQNTISGPMLDAVTRHLVTANEDPGVRATLVNKHNVKVTETPKEILVEVLKAWDKVAEKHCKENPFFNKVYQSQKEYAKRIVPYKRLNEPPYELAADYYWKQANPYKVQKP